MLAHLKSFTWEIYVLASRDLSNPYAAEMSSRRVAQFTGQARCVRMALNKLFNARKSTYCNLGKTLLKAMYKIL